MPKIINGRYLTQDEVSEVLDLKRKGHAGIMDIAKYSGIGLSWSQVGKIINGKAKAIEEDIRKIKKYLQICERCTRKIREG